MNLKSEFKCLLKVVRNFYFLFCNDRNLKKLFFALDHIITILSSKLILFINYSQQHIKVNNYNSALSFRQSTYLFYL